MTVPMVESLPHYLEFTDRLEAGAPVITWARYGEDSRGVFKGGITAGGPNPESRLFVANPNHAPAYATPTLDGHITQADIWHHELLVQSYPSSMITTQCYASRNILTTTLVHDPEMFGQHSNSQTLTFAPKRPYSYSLSNESDRSADVIWVAGDDTVTALANHLEKIPDKSDNNTDCAAFEDMLYAHKIITHPLFALYGLIKEMGRRAGKEHDDSMDIEKSKTVKAKLDSWRKVAAAWIEETGWNPNSLHTTMCAVFDIELPNH